MSVFRIRRLIGPVLLMPLLSVPSVGAIPAQTRSNPDAATISDFKKRVDAYVAVHKKLENTLPKLPKEATPQQIDEHQRALAKLIQEDRAGMRPGNLLTPDM